MLEEQARWREWDLRRLKLIRCACQALYGSGAEDVSVGKITGPVFDEDGIVDAIERVTDKYLEVREKGERFLDTYHRVGFNPFKEAIYGRA